VEDASMGLHQNGSIKSMASKFDPVEHAKAQRALNMNHATIPVIHKIRTQTIEEFLPELWEELKLGPAVYRAVAVKTYNAVRRRLDGV
jgi:hypothetical protein